MSDIFVIFNYYNQINNHSIIKYNNSILNFPKYRLITKFTKQLFPITRLRHLFKNIIQNKF